ALFGVVQIVSAAILQGLGAERAAAWHLLAAAAVKVALNVWLVPRWGIAGAAIAAVAAYAVAAGLNLARLRRMRFVHLPWRQWTAKPIACTAAMAAAAGAVVWAAPQGLAALAPGMPSRL